ncbi:hypothetical protein IW261DRAFT_1589916 [Armillaria novae-zelandiae]|uniref:Uncharacterized protein n=1 Tax=Armillaria novae-zelandiae TaxID=153914 RepID=A0AA39UHG0_9AGAR|nr:hypothetical protein IW261DRAFT_1589916 [Armillaria novae-zelandiae]
MASRAFTSSLRAALRRPALNRVAVPSCKRFNSTHAPSAPSSDTPWIIGSAVVFGPLLLYLLKPDGKKTDHHHAKSEHKPEPVVEEKEAEAPAPAAEESAPEPPAEAPAAETTSAPAAETASETATITDDEGTPVSAEEVKESIQQAEASDAPKEAAAEEKKEASS